MKKFIAMLLIISFMLSLSLNVAADVQTEPTFVPEVYTREELLAMDPYLDSDGDGLEDVIELVYEFNRFDADTDGDGVSDYTEFCITCTDVLVPDGDVDTDGDGLTNAEEGVHGTNPDDLDTDNDTLTDDYEILVLGTDPIAKDTDGDGVRDHVELELGLDPLLTMTDGVTPDAERVPSDESAPHIALPIKPPSGSSTYAIDPPVIGGEDPGIGSTTKTYSGTLYTGYTDNGIPVSYSISFSRFLSFNTTYSQDIAIVSSLLSAIAYDESYLTNTNTTAATSEYALENWFSLNAFSGYARYDLDYHATDNPSGYQDQHVSEMFIAHKTLSTSANKTLVCVVIRGTNGTLDEWQSNFDMGTTANYASVTEWTKSTNHMGFDITANRLNTKLTAYMNANGLTASNSVLWITGHSRGAALTNLLAAKQVDAGYNVFAYAFATPGTTQASTASNTAYDCIFNIINQDDLVPQLPMSAWGFTRYGQNVPGSIEATSGYAGEWDDLMGGNLQYTSQKTAVTTTVSIISNIAENRNGCYTYRYDEDGYLQGSNSDYDNVVTMRNSITTLFPYNAGNYWYSTINYRSASLDYEYRIYQQPAFLMQVMAFAMYGLLPKLDYLAVNVAPYLEDAKSGILGIAFPSKIDHPHYPESYYFLATKLD